MRILLALVFCFFCLVGITQEYFPFPTDTAQWNVLTRYSNSPNYTAYYNFQYRMRGDTIINNTEYNKIYLYEDELGPSEIYLGGLREDSLKNIYFFPDIIYGSGYGGPYFPSDTAEYLLYTFNNLQVGSSVSINPNDDAIYILEIDSILLGDSYRKRYLVDNGNMLGLSHWIEGIGGTKDLFEAYSYEFEWSLHTLCFTDSLTYYINSPNGADSCHYWLNSNVEEYDFTDLRISPNPVNEVLFIQSDDLLNNRQISIQDAQGRLIKKIILKNRPYQIDVDDLELGLYFISLEGEERKTLRFLKE